MVSAFATESGLCIGQEGTRGKGNEIVGIKTLLDTLMLKDCIVTIDAIGCQTEIAEKIVSRGGDYLLAVKENQGNLYEAIDEFFDEGQTRGFGNTVVNCFETLEKDHGRIESRRYVWIDRLDWMEPSIRNNWKNLAGVGVVERQRGDQRQGLHCAHALHWLQRHCLGPGAGQRSARPLGGRKSPALGARCHIPRGRMPGTRRACATQSLIDTKVRFDATASRSAIPQTQLAKSPKNR
jgi:predicted transposase YbfD/YdcC